MKKVLNALKFVWKNNKVWLLVSVITLVIIFTATLVATQNTFLVNTISTVLGGERRVLVSGDPSQYNRFLPDGNGFKQFETELDLTGNYNKSTGKYDAAAKNAVYAEANRLNEQIAEEGIVLLKNENGALPLSTSAASKTKISVFGKNSVNLVYGGSGSGGGDTARAKTIFDSLDAVNYDVNPTLKAFYENRSQSGSGRGANPQMGVIPAGLTTGETPWASYTSSVKNSFSDYKAAALVVISRIGGEGFDLPRTMKTSLSGSSPVAGAASADDHYLQLDKNEKDLLAEVCNAGFEQVILVVNCSTSMELGFLDDGTYDIDAAVWIGSPGGSGIMALGRILNGSVNPSGRLVDTYARDFKKDPTFSNFSNNGNTDGNRYLIGNAAQNAYFVDYEESIYVGYRYYETRGFEEDDEWYDKNVVFPFGYGLSYSQFEWELVSTVPAGYALTDKNGKISVTVNVKNKGPLPGKDVVQLYYSAPYWGAGQIEKAHVVLGAFEKTPVIPAGGEHSVTLTLKISDMASYDWNDANGNNFKGYELEDGDYTIYIGRDANHAWRGIDSIRGDDNIEINYYVDRDPDISSGFLYREDSVTTNDVVNRFDDINSHFSGATPKVKLMSRANFEASRPSAPTNSDRQVTAEFIDSLLWKLDDKESKQYYAVDMPTQGWKPGENETAYKLQDMITTDSNGNVTVDYDDNTKWDNILNQITVSEMAYMIGTGNFNTYQIQSIGKPKTTDPDGPAGFTNFMEMGSPTVYDTCYYVSGCVIAATWNKDLVHDMGVMIGHEGIIGNAKGDGRSYSGWYAPAVNLHRSPFSGRNFEYYSEDSYLSGIIGANAVTGAKSKGVYTYVKHFAVNDQETNRDTNGLITWLTEQTLREIYLKPFEIIVKVGKTTAMMSSFNRIGTVWAGGSYELMTEVLRDEWGFRGTVISDYNLYDHMPADQMIRAGGDLNLTQNGQPTTTSEALTATQVTAMRNATKNILYTVAGSNAMNGMGEGVVWRYAMPMWILLLIWLNIVLVVGFAVWGFFAIRHKLKKTKNVKSGN